MLSVAEDTAADMVYADFRDVTLEQDGSRKVRVHPLIDCREGALRDDFDFGPVLIFRSSSFRKAAGEMEEDFSFAAMYDLRLRMKKTVRIGEYLYSAVKTDNRLSGEKQFDYVNPRNREVQIEMERVCTAYLSRTGALITPEYKDIDFDMEGFGIKVSVIIPVYNRVRTIADAV
ncbi:glycosyltransferase, group 2 family protein, partial [gut metagenome]